MGGRLQDWLGTGLAAARPAAAGMAALLTQAGVAFYFSHDDKILHIYDDDAVDWYEVDVAALAALSFQTLPDVDWSTPPTDGQVFVWDTVSGKLQPFTLPTLLYNTAEELQDAVGAMGVNGTGTTFVYDDALGQFRFDCTITQYTDEMVMDIIAGAFAAGTHTGLTISYDDALDKYSFGVSTAFIDAQIAAASIGDLSDVDHTTPPTAGQVPTWNGTDYAPATPTGLPSGTVFPGSPADGDLFYRTDRKIEYFYSAAAVNWLSRQLFNIEFLRTEAAGGDTLLDRRCPPYLTLYSVWLERFEAVTYTSGAGDWNVTLGWVSAANVSTIILTLDCTADPAATWVHHYADIDALLDANAMEIIYSVDEIAGATVFYVAPRLWYRLVG